MGNLNAKIGQLRQDCDAVEAEMQMVIDELCKAAEVKRPSFLQWVKAQLPWLFAVACVILPFTQ